MHPDSSVERDGQQLDYDQKMYKFPNDYRPYKPYMEHETFPFIIGGLAIGILFFWMYDK